jgi:hypothetical protein
VKIKADQLRKGKLKDIGSPQFELDSEGIDAGKAKKRKGTIKAQVVHPPGSK